MLRWWLAFAAPAVLLSAPVSVPAGSLLGVRLALGFICQCRLLGLYYPSTPDMQLALFKLEASSGGGSFFLLACGVPVPQPQCQCQCQYRFQMAWCSLWENDPVAGLWAMRGSKRRHFWGGQVRPLTRGCTTPRAM